MIIPDCLKILILPCAIAASVIIGQLLIGWLRRLRLWWVLTTLTSVTAVIILLFTKTTFVPCDRNDAVTKWMNKHIPTLVADCCKSDR